MGNRFCTTVIGALFIAVMAVTSYAAEGEGRLAPLRVLQDDYPRAFFFRGAEAVAARRAVPYEQWEQTFGRLTGIEGKAQDEELENRAKPNIEWFTRFKQSHHDQVVLLHYNGDARDPRTQEGRFFAGHWLYHNGATILDDVPADAGETELHVADARLFRAQIGRYKTANEDVGLCEIDDAGRPNWAASEQVELVAVDMPHKTIRVKRGAYGTAPRTFKGGKAYAAAHSWEGPWTPKSHLLWRYNYSTACPRDAKGRTCADVLVDELAEKFATGGELAAFDGVEFDVLNHGVPVPRVKNPIRGEDCDADGKMDFCLIDGVNTYGAGVVDFCKKLRQRLGGDRIIQADGWDELNQRAFGLLNGVESEGWPSLRDYEIRDWSGGMNRQSFWVANSVAPNFSYVNHKFIVSAPPGQPANDTFPDLPFSTHRLVFAGAMFCDSAICYTMPPKVAPGERYGVWDELWAGSEQRLGYLGKPLGPAVHLSQQLPDRLGAAAPRGTSLFVPGDGVSVVADGAAIKVSGKQGQDIQLTLKNLPADGTRDLMLVFTARAQPLVKMPAEVGRAVHLGPSGSPGSLAWINGKPFTLRFALGDLNAKTIDISATIEGGEPVWLSDLSLHGGPDACYRLFERGVVLANPSTHPCEFDLAALLPGKHFRRLRGTPLQDPKANDGSPVGVKLELPAKDALFLVAE